MVPRKRGSRKILAGSRNLGGIFDKSRQYPKSNQEE